MEPRPAIDDNDYNEWMAANPEAEHSVEEKYCDLMTAMPDEDDEEVFRLALRHVVPLSLYKPPKDLLFPGVIGFELLVKVASDFVDKIAARSDVLPQQRQSLVAAHKALAGLPQKRPEGEYAVAITYTPRAQGQGMLRHYFSLELSPDCLQLDAGEFDEMNDHNGTFSFELSADGDFSESGSVGVWAEGIEQSADPTYEVNVSAELPDMASPPQGGPAAPPPDLTEDERPRPPPPPIMTWEEIEQGCPGQLDLNFPKLIPIPTIAERAFLTLAREWLAEVEKAPKDSALPRAADMRALSCLLLAVESGSKFTDVARQQMEINREAAEARRPPSWIDQLPWKLCQSAFLMSPQQSNAVQELTVNLDHHNSSIRCWMMKIGWFVAPWLNPVEATTRLLKNLADTLSGPFMAAGLAARLFDKEDDFLTFARTFTPSDSFEEQYQNRLKRVEELGIQAVQAPFWETEAICRKEIERAVLGFRMRKVGKHKMEGKEP